MIYLSIYDTKAETCNEFIAYFEADTAYGDKNYLCFIEKEQEKDNPLFLRRLSFKTLMEMKMWMIDNSDTILRLAKQDSIIIPVYEE